MCNWLPVACWHGHCLCPYEKVFKTTPAKPRNATKKVKQTAKNYAAFFSSNWLNHTTVCARTTITTATQITGSLSSPRSCRVLPHTGEYNNSFLVCSAAAATRPFSTSAQNDGFWWMEKIIIVQKLFPCGGSLVLLGQKNKCIFGPITSGNRSRFQTDRHIVQEERRENIEPANPRDDANSMEKKQHCFPQK